MRDARPGLALLGHPARDWPEKVWAATHERAVIEMAWAGLERMAGKDVPVGLPPVDRYDFYRILPYPDQWVRVRWWAWRLRRVLMPTDCWCGTSGGRSGGPELPGDTVHEGRGATRRLPLAAGRRVPGADGRGAQPLRAEGWDRAAFPGWPSRPSTDLDFEGDRPVNVRKALVKAVAAATPGEPTTLAGTCSGGEQMRRVRVRPRPGLDSSPTGLGATCRRRSGPGFSVSASISCSMARRCCVRRARMASPFAASWLLTAAVTRGPCTAWWPFSGKRSSTTCSATAGRRVRSRWPPRARWPPAPEWNRRPQVERLAPGGRFGRRLGVRGGPPRVSRRSS